MNINLDLFGLSINQTRILFSIEKYLVEKDINESEQKKAKKRMVN